MIRASARDAARRFRDGAGVSPSPRVTAFSLQLAAGASVSAAFFHYLAGALALAGMVAVAG